MRVSGNNKNKDVHKYRDSENGDGLQRFDSIYEKPEDSVPENITIELNSKKKKSFKEILLEFFKKTKQKFYTKVKNTKEVATEFTPIPHNTSPPKLTFKKKAQNYWRNFVKGISRNPRSK